MRSITPTSSPSAPPRRSRGAPTCRPRPWCASPSRSASAASPTCRRCSAPTCAPAGPTIRSGLRRCTRPPATAAIRPIFWSDSPNSAAASIARLREGVHRRELDSAIDILGRARTIYCLGQRRAFSVAHYLTYALAQLGLSACLIDNVGGLGPEQFARAGRDDALIAISFAPYSPVTIDLAKRARRAGTPTVVVTNSALSPLAGLADVRFEIVESDFGSFRSLAATFCLAMTLAVAVAEQRATGQ